MLTYTFSRREKGLILVLAIILIIVAWYMLVFQPTTERVTELQREISVVDEQSAIASAQVSQMRFMEDVIEQRKAEGVKPTPVPMYDNMQPLMARLDAVMAVTDSYQLSFGELELGSTGYIMRPVVITFGCDSYEVAESVVQALAKGPYPCIVDAVSISDGSYRSARTRDAGVACSGTISVTFFEKNDGSFAVPVDEGAAA